MEVGADLRKDKGYLPSLVSQEKPLSDFQVRGGCCSLAPGSEPLAGPKGSGESGVSRFLRASAQMGPSYVSESHSFLIRALI